MDFVAGGGEGGGEFGVGGRHVPATGYDDDCGLLGGHWELGEGFQGLARCLDGKFLVH